MGDDCLAANRSKRARPDKSGSWAALAKFKEARKSGTKYQLEEDDDVYEEVTEEEYAKIVNKRTEEDWIVDDGTGYVEDGREIFDDDEREAESVAKKRKEEKRKNANIRPEGQPAKNIRSMFAAQSGKAVRKPEAVAVEDEALEDLLGELHRPRKKAGQSAGSRTPMQQKQKLVLQPIVNAAPKPRYNPFSSSRMAASRSRSQSHVEPEVPSPAGPSSAVPSPAGPSSAVPSSAVSSPVVPSPAITIPSREEKMIVEVGEATTADFPEEEASVEETPNVTGISTQWMATCTGEDDAKTATEVGAADSSDLPLSRQEDGKAVLRVFWFDAFEDQFKQPGSVYLFGKVKVGSQYESICLAIKNVEKKIFLLPRETKRNEPGEPVAMADLYKEFNDNVAPKFGISKFRSRMTDKHYCFSIADIPAESSYLEVRYSAEYGSLPADISGDTFSRAFGTNTSGLETFLLDRKLKGPCWLNVLCPDCSKVSMSWCRKEAVVLDPDNVLLCEKPPPPPPLVLLSFSLKTLHNKRTRQNEIVSVAYLVQNKFELDKSAPRNAAFQQHCCILHKPFNAVFPYDFSARSKQVSMRIERVGSENSLLNLFLARLVHLDPDVLVGHDVASYDLDVLLHRISRFKVRNWSRLGRLKRTIMPKLQNKSHLSSSAAVAGRLLVDVKLSAQELIRCRSYDLTALCSQVLGEQRRHLEQESVSQFWNSSAELLTFVDLALKDSLYALKVAYELNVLPLAMQITNICGNVMSQTLLRGRSERNEFLLLHAFSEKDFIVPDKSFLKRKFPATQQEGEGEVSSSRRKPAYSGGLVLEPKKGFYDSHILLLDFNSLYPSIIQEYNICFTTVPLGDDETIPDSSLPPGILPTEIRKLVERRRQVKSLMNAGNLTQDQVVQYDIRQRALKLTANSMYGCLGFTQSRFYAQNLAALITRQGRNILSRTVDLVRAMSYDVIYGDTDSIMINTNNDNIDEVFAIGYKIRSEINKLYRLLEIDIDGVYKSMLLLKKKKYAALAVQKKDGGYATSKELKGLDIVRRDWCQLAKDTGNFVVDEILSGQPREAVLESIHGKLGQVGRDVRDKKLGEDMFHIAKALTKDPADYPDKRSLPHVQVALRHNAEGGKMLAAGDTVFYVVCNDGTALPHGQRSYSPGELAESPLLEIDYTYYLSSQIHPVVTRLMEPIEGTDSARIAEALGLDPSGFRSRARADPADDDDDGLLGACELEERFRECEALRFVCAGCGTENRVSRPTADDGRPSLSCCQNAECPVVPCQQGPALVNNVSLAVGVLLKRYYRGAMLCEDVACMNLTFRTPTALAASDPLCPACRRSPLKLKFTDGSLHNQLSFYRWIFTPDKGAGELAPYYDYLRHHVDAILSHSAYSVVSLGRLFDRVTLAT